ncbi:condensation domain-containing protein [Williamsia sp. 1135]|uniref:condensation domain-containing protein n=1 Tax=Williamsia sp. 1135 TaxID=1889262 RepID=UPI001439178B|nr:condensation domain-containing protein [Williamsia sp. 1135]
MEAARPPLVALTDPEIAVLSASFGAIRDILPLSPLQEGFFYHLQMANESGETDLYASQSRSRVRGSLDTDRMTDAISELLTRNENLTAGFVTIGGRAVQVIPETARSRSEWSGRTVRVPTPEGSKRHWRRNAAHLSSPTGHR